MTASATLIESSPIDYRQAIGLIWRYADQPIMLFDAFLAMMSARMEIPVWTFDHHFDVMGANVWR